jgi:DNA polymerase-3 subunit beta
VATDSHRLAYCETQLENTHLPHHEVIIPRKTVIELQRLLGDAEDAVTADMATNQLRLRFGDVELLTKLVEGKFPDYQRVIPKTHNRRLVVARDTLASALSRASILTTDKFRGVRLALSVEEGLRIHSNNAEQEEAHEEVEVNYQGDPLEIGFNVGYLQDVLSTLKTDSVQIDFGDANMSALVTVPGDDQFKYVVMPMRI